MMDAYSAGLLVEAFACNARVAAMEAENQYRLGCGNGIAYGEEAFQREADMLDHLAVALRNRG